jgi:hypothetical protein
MHSKKQSSRKLNKLVAQEIKSLALNTRLAKSETTDLILDYLTSIDCPRALSVWIMFKNNEHDQLSELKCNPLHYRSASDFSDAYLASEFLSKSTFLNTTFDKKAKALVKFDLFEKQCRETNKRLKSEFWKQQPELAELIFLAQRKIASILGEFSGEEWIELSNWGPGVTVGLNNQQTASVPKFQHEAGITRDLHCFVSDLFPVAYPLWWKSITEDQSNGQRREAFSITVGNRVTTVPKTSSIDRVIAIEPGLNLWFQKGIGRMIRTRMGKIGIDLNLQEINQLLAKQGSISNLLATVDFSSASDSISLELVRLMLPPRWFFMMDVCRSKCGSFDSSSTFWWEKFSSMGNAFTWELESLIFYSLAWACCQKLHVPVRDVSVYGDDVIVPVESFDLFSRLSEFCGFTLNQKKSYSNGPFRESCGAHWYRGVNCKPIFLKERVHNAQAVIKLANNIRLLAHRLNNCYGCDSRFRGCWTRLFRRLPKPLRLCVSRELGDVGFITNFDEACPPIFGHGIEGFRVRTLGVKTVYRQSEHLAVQIARLKAPSTQEDNNNYPLRGRTNIAIHCNVLVRRWYSLGPWL